MKIKEGNGHLDFKFITMDALPFHLLINIMDCTGQTNSMPLHISQVLSDNYSIFFDLLRGGYIIVAYQAEKYIMPAIFKFVKMRVQCQPFYIQEAMLQQKLNPLPYKEWQPKQGEDIILNWWESLSWVDLGEDLDPFTFYDGTIPHPPMDELIKIRIQDLHKMRAKYKVLCEELKGKHNLPYHETFPPGDYYRLFVNEDGKQDMELIKIKANKFNQTGLNGDELFDFEWN